MEENEVLVSMDPRQEKVIVDVLDGWWPRLPDLPDPRQAQWHGKLFDGDNLNIDATTDRLFVELRVLGSEVQTEGDDLFLLAAPLIIVLKDGSRIYAESALAYGRFPSPITEPRLYFTYRLEIEQWSWQRKPAFAWLLEADGRDQLDVIGNLSVRTYFEKQSMEVVLNNLCLDGLMRSCLLQPSSGPRKSIWCVFNPAIDAWLESERLLIAFALGHRIGAGNAIAIDERGETVGVRYVRYRSGAPGSQRDTVPRMESQCWPADFLEQLSRAAIHDDALTSSVIMYVDSLSDTHTGQLLKISSALTILSTDNDLTDGSRNGSSFGDRIQQAFTAAGISADEFLSPLQTFQPLHDAYKVFERDVFHGLRVLETCRTAFIALVAKRIEYVGPICYWDLSPTKQETIVPSWWPQPPAVASKRFHIDANRPASAVGWGKWPDFRLPGPPATPLLIPLESFAMELRGRTRGLVAAILIPRLRPDGEEHAYDFTILIRARPDVRSVLFTIRAFSEGIVIQGWAEQEIRLSSYPELKRFLSEVANAPQTRIAIERFMLIGSAATDRQ